MKTLNEILKCAGIKTIRTELKSVVYLEYNGKKILRPNSERCYDKVLSEFNINLKEFE